MTSSKKVDTFFGIWKRGTSYCGHKVTGLDHTWREKMKLEEGQELNTLGTVTLKGLSE